VVNPNASRSLRWEDLSSGDQDLFVRHAGPALERRNEAFFRARRALWIDWILTGGMGLFGIWVLGWSAMTAVGLLLATFWLGWIADVVQWRLRAPNLAISYVRDGDDMRLWQIVSILRGRRRQAPDVRGHPSLALSVIVDLIAGSAAMALLWRGLQEAGTDFLTLAKSPSLMLGVALIIVVGILPAQRARFRPAVDGSVALPLFSVGQRGIGLLVLVFGLMAAGGGPLGGSVLMSGAYGFFVAMAAIELIWGLPMLRAETDWLQRQRAQAGIVHFEKTGENQNPP